MLLLHFLHCNWGSGKLELYSASIVVAEKSTGVQKITSMSGQYTVYSISAAGECAVYLSVSHCSADISVYLGVSYCNADISAVQSVVALTHLYNAQC